MNKLVGLTLGISLLGLVVAARAQDDVHHHPGMSEEIDRFYSKWKMPDQRQENDERVTGCCGLQDCHPAEVKIERGVVYARTAYSRGWLLVPANKIESNYNDMVESPDGRNHMCHNDMGFVYCFTFGIQI